MGLDDLLKPNSTIFHLHAACKRETLSAMAERAGKLVDHPADDILRLLLEREQLGSTGVGDGVGIPHAKIEGLKEITGVLALLDKPVAYESMDDQPVDIVFLLLAPANATAAHLKALARVSRLLRDDEARAALRGADSAEALLAIALSDQKHHAA